MPTHSEIAHAVAALQLGISASELHGSLVGYLLGGGLVSRDRWLDDLLIEAPPAGEHAAARAVLDGLVESTRRPAPDAPESLAPLLPGAGASLKDRGQAMTEWSAGFLGGLGISGAASNANSGPVADLLAAIARIAGIRWSKASAPEEDAVHFDDIVAFLRDSLATLASELPRAPLAAAPSALRH